MKKKILLFAGLSALLVVACLGLWLAMRPSQESVGNKADVEWYREDGSEFTISTVEELYDLVKLSKYYDFKGQTIKLGADIVVNEGNVEDWETEMPEREWSPIYQFAGTFDGQGHTISGIYATAYMLGDIKNYYVDAPAVEGVSGTKFIYLPTGLFACTKEECVIKNLNLVNSVFYNDVTTGCGSIVSNGAGTLDSVYSSATIINYRRNAGGLVGIVEKGSFNINNCWFDGEIRMEGKDGRQSGGLVANISSNVGTTKITHCLNTADIVSEFTRADNNVGGLVGTLDKGARVEIEDSLSVGKITVANRRGAGTAIGVQNDGSMTTMKNVYTNADGYAATIGTMGGTTKSYPLELKENCLIGTSALEWTNLNFKTFWTVVDGDTPILRTFADATSDKTSMPKAYNVDWYDQKKSEYTISTLEELYGFYVLSATNDFTGKTIKLGADIAVNEGDARQWKETAPDKVWYPIKRFAGTFDGQGHTISGVYLHTYQTGSGLFTSTASTAVLKNFRLTNSYFANEADNFSYFGSIVGCAQGRLDTIYSDAIISNTATRSCGGLVGVVNGTETVRIQNCWYDGELTIVGQKGSQGGGIAGRVETNSSVQIEHCLNTGSLTSEREKGIVLLGGIVGVSGDGKVEIRDTLNVGSITGLIDNGLGSAISWVNNKTDLSFYNTYATSESCIKAVDNVQGTYNGGCLRIDEKYLVGNKGYQWTLLDFDKYWAVQKNGTPILQSFAEEIPSVDGIKKHVDVSWYKVKDKEYKLDSVQDLYGFAYLSYNTNFVNKTIKLTKNIEANTGSASEWASSEPAKPWFPINKFAGTFDGQGRTIKGLYMRNNQQRAGMFSTTTDKAIVKNFRLENSYFKHEGDTNGQLGSIVGDFSGTMSTVYSSAIVEGDKLLYGGLIGMINNVAKVSNCWFDGTVSLGEKGGWVGGIVGLLQGGKEITLEHCLSTGTVATKNKNAPSLGGVIGIISGEKTTVKVTDTLSAATIVCDATATVGSFIGHQSEKTNLTVQDTYATRESSATSFGGKKGNLKGICYTLESNMLSGLNGYRYTTLNFKNYWAAMEASTPVLKSFGGSGMSVDHATRMIDTSWYKEGKKVYELKDVQDLYGFALVSQETNFKDKTVKLANSIVVNEGVAAFWTVNEAENRWIPINNFAGTFDGQGHSISGIYLKTALQKGGLFTLTTTDATLKNFRLENSYFGYEGTKPAQMGSIAGEFGGTLDSVYSDAIIKGDKLVYGGLTGYVLHGATFTNCWYNGDMILGEKGGWAGGITGVVQSGCTAVIEHCLNTGTISTEYTDAPSVGGICGIITGDNTTVTVRDTLNTGNVICAKEPAVGSFIGFVIENTNLTIEDTYATKESNVRTIGGKKGNVVGACYAQSTDLITGKNGYRFTTLDFDKYWAAREAETPILKSFTGVAINLNGVARMIDTNWYDASKTVYELEDKEDLYGFAILSMGTNFKGKTVKLKYTITVNEGDAKTWGENAPINPWIPISSFAGTFDGQGNSIQGIYLKTSEQKGGLFSLTTAAATVKNLRLENSYFEYTGTKPAQMGSIAGEFGGTLDSVYSNAIIKGDRLLYGGLTGYVLKGATFTSCWFDGDMILGEKGGWAGGITGTIQGGVKVSMTHCLNTGRITCKNTNAPSVGGICGVVTGSKNQFELVDSLSAGTITCSASRMVGALLGYIEGNNEMTCKNTYATNEIHATVLESASKAKVDGECLRVPASNLEGLKGYQFTFLDFAQSWAAVDGITPVPKTLAQNALTISVDKMIDLNWYDDALYATKGYYELMDANDLYGFAYTSLTDDFRGKVVKLGANIDVNIGTATENGWVKADTNGTDYNWTPIGAGNPFAGTFDGQGHTITGIYLKTTTRASGLFSATTGDAVIKDFRLKNSYYETSNFRMGSIVAEFSGRMDSVYSDAIMKCDKSKNRFGGLIGIINGATTISNCQFAGTLSTGDYSGGIVGCIDDGANTEEIVIEHCLFNGQIKVAIKGSNVGGICGVALKAKSVMIEDTISSGDIALVDGVASAIRGSIFGYIYKNYALKNSYGNKHGDAGSTEIGIYGGKSSDVTDSIVGSMKITLGNYVGAGSSKLENLDFANYWVAKQTSTPELQSFTDVSTNYTHTDIWAYKGWVNNYTTNDEGKKVYTISSKEALYGLAAIVDGGKTFKDEIVQLGADIPVNAGKATENGWTENASPFNWTPIGSSVDANTVKPFAGTFDGQGHTIRGIYLKTSERASGLFAATTNDTIIKDFRLENSYFETTGFRLGSIVAEFKGRMDTVYSDAIVKCDKSKNRFGGLIGIINGTATISNCQFVGTLNAGDYSGGLVGCIDDGENTNNVVIEHCLFNGKFNIASKGTNVGGICGMVLKAKSITIDDTISSGDLALASGVASAVRGSIIGYTYKNYTLKNSYGNKHGDGGSTEIGIHGGKDSSVSETIIGSMKITLANYVGAGSSKLVNLDFSKYWAPKQTTTPELQSFTDEATNYAHTDIWAYEGWVNNSTTNDDGKVVYTIDTKEALYGLASVAQGKTFAGNIVELGADITVNEGVATENGWTENNSPSNWTPIGSTDKRFAGTFDGKGHTISGIYYLTSEAKGTGLFGATSDSAVIKNFCLENSYFQTSVNRLGSVVGNFGGTMDSVYSSAFVNCTATNRFGGLIAIIDQAATITNCQFDGKLSTPTFAGGIVGYIDDGGNTKDVRIEHCLNTGEITVKEKGASVGGVIGVAAKAKSIVIHDTLSAGHITLAEGITSSSVGSLVGLSYKDINITKTYVTSECYKKDINTSGVTLTSACITVSEDDIKGELARNNASELSYYAEGKDSSSDGNEKKCWWSVVEGKLPVLESFLPNVTKAEAVNQEE